ncbi:MAG: AarF/ABC1/UbiB kinase family protein [Rhodothermales bacterium]|nr:AarF/ABC1/UbiB kinase family protein [Rhodothermales bacterium]
MARSAVGAGGEQARRDMHRQNAQDMFKELSKLRGTALKFAQGMSMDPGLIPAEFIEVMSQAQYSVPPMNAALVRRLVRKALGAPVEELYASFEPNAVAAASIGQVHRATLHDGRVVAVKVQYPNVRETIDADLTIARGIASRVAKGNVDPFIEEIRDMMLLETDYLQEGRNIEFFAEQYNDDEVVTPRWIPDLSSQSVLTMTFVEGRHIKPFLEANPSRERRNHFGQLLFDFSHRQVASGLNTIHADFHPGNFLFQDDGRLGVIDFGCVKTLPDAFMHDFLRVFRAQLEGDEDLLRTLYFRLDILNPNHDQELQDKIFAFFLKMGELIVAPYREGSFDFGRTEFAEQVKAIGTEAMQFREREVIGSPHFVFVNRVVFGLLSMLSKLGAVVETQRGYGLVNQAIDRLEAEAA